MITIQYRLTDRITLTKLIWQACLDVMNNALEDSLKLGSHIMLMVRSGNESNPFATRGARNITPQNAK